MRVVAKMVLGGGGAVSYEQGTPVLALGGHLPCQTQREKLETKDTGTGMGQLGTDTTAERSKVQLCLSRCCITNSVSPAALWGSRYKSVKCSMKAKTLRRR